MIFFQHILRQVKRKPRKSDIQLAHNLFEQIVKQVNRLFLIEIKNNFYWGFSASLDNAVQNDRGLDS